MAITDLPLFSMLRTRMQWHQERQRLLSENVANADTPNFRPRDLAPLQFDRHDADAGVDRPRAHRSRAISPRRRRRRASSQTSRVRRLTRCAPTGNAVNLEDEMIKVAANQMDYQAATTLYTRSLGLIKTALGKR